MAASGADPPRSLRLLAEDADDLAVISAALQDAVTRVGDIRWEAEARRLTLAFNRFRWEADVAQADADGSDATGSDFDGEHGGERVRAGLQLGGVLAVKARRLRQDAGSAVLELLALTFEPGEAPGGRITFAFAAGADLVAEVECIDAALADLTPPWSAASKPEHQA
jgi:hypothetical protein